MNLRSTVGEDPKHRLLIVDDEDHVRDLLVRVLRQRYDTTTVRSAEEALAVAQGASFDLLITDLAMPGIPGDELARRLRQSNPGLKILYVTGYPDRLFEARGVLWEDEAFLDKPISIPGLLEAIALILVGHIPPARASRVKIPGARIRLADQPADLATMSVTGALVRSDGPALVGSHIPIRLELPSETLQMTARVVSSEATSDGTQPGYAIALAFDRRSAHASAALERAVRDAVQDAGSPPLS